mmetsp:Transcript_26368/g.43396  ORF Transcript_26368/g.43396 Transcript_26368/m.43396 type:complete len:256 (-) Transcript_26368:279-1046(-)
MLLKSHAVSFLLGVLAVGGELPVAGPAVAAQVLAVAVEVPREHGLDRVAVQEDEAEVVHLVFWDFNHFLLVVQVTVHELDIPPVLALFDRYSPEAGVLERRVQFAEGGLGVVHVPDVVHQPRRAHRDQAAEHLAPAAPVGGNDVGPALLCIAEGPLPPFLPGSLQLVPGGLPVGGGGCPALEHGQAAAAAALCHHHRVALHRHRAPFHGRQAIQRVSLTVHCTAVGLLVCSEAAGEIIKLIRNIVSSPVELWLFW